MFGLEDQRKKKSENEFVFDLEKDLKSGKKLQEMKALIEKRVQNIKKILRSGEDKEEFDQFGVLLHGYASLLKVVARLTP